MKKDKWNDIAIEVYYDPQHPYNVDRMIDSMKKSLAYYTKNFSPYQFRQVRILEFPNFHGSFAQSFANTIPYSESIGFIADLRDKDDIDYVFYITAHEVAHQWWAHQVIGGNVQGATMLSESFAQYSALMVMEHEYGATQMRKFLKYELDNYLRSRATERVEEQPLALNENQQYIHYRKGSVVIYALKDYLGEDTVNATLSAFVKAKAFQQPPYTTSYELLDLLRANTDPKWKSLIADLFDKITLFDDRVTSATAKKRDDGKYDVSIALHAEKKYTRRRRQGDAGHDRHPDRHRRIRRAADGKEANEKVLFLEKRVVADGDSTITITVDARALRSRHRPVQQARRPRFRGQPQEGDAELTREPGAMPGNVRKKEHRRDGRGRGDAGHDRSPAIGRKRLLAAHRAVVLLVVDARALMILLALDARLLARADMAVRARVRLAAIDVRLAALQRAGLVVAQLTRADALVDARLLVDVALHVGLHALR